MYHRRRRRLPFRRKAPFFTVILFLLTVATMMFRMKYETVAEAALEPAPESYHKVETVTDQPAATACKAVLTSDVVPVPEVVSVPATEPTLEESFRYYDHIALEYDLQKLVWMACEETGCSYELALAVIFRETSYRNVNGDNGNSIGYMQIQPRWHYERMESLGVTDLSDPLSNFRVGCDLLVDLIEQYGSVEFALTCYNTGSPGMSKYAAEVLTYMNNTFS